MASEWYYSHNGERHGPVSTSQLKEMAAAGRLRGDDLVWKDGMETWLPAGKVKGLILAASVAPAAADRPAAAEPGPAVPAGDLSNRQLAVGLTAIWGGAFGIHKFILGNTTPALIHLLVTVLTFGVGAAVMAVIGAIEGVIYLRMSADEFHQTYVVNRKSWF